MVYCQRCGRKLDEAHLHCPYCGVLQECNLDGEKKLCRKCEEKIPVNSNYCPYCGHDQAIFEYRETPREIEKKRISLRLSLDLKKMPRI